MLKHCLALFCVAVACASAQTTLYFDDFSGSGSSDLNGTAPDIRPGSETWIAGSESNDWKADGSISAGGDSNAFLPFSPSPGQIYTLSIDANPVNANDDWFAIGFTPSDSVNSSYAEDPVSASPWMLLRGQRASNLQTFLGPGTTDGADFNPTEDSTPLLDGVVNLKIVLDTTGEQWTAEWVVNNVSIRQTTFDTNPTINYVGLGRWETAIGTVDNFTLTSASAIPEPATYALTLAAFAAGAAALRRRKRNTMQ
jgi:hypothetical protein